LDPQDGRDTAFSEKNRVSASRLEQGNMIATVPVFYCAHHRTRRADALKRVRPPGSNTVQISRKNLFYKNYSLSSFREKREREQFIAAKRTDPLMLFDFLIQPLREHPSPWLTPVEKGDRHKKWPI
jgi:hypothetical protein